MNFILDRNDYHFVNPTLEQANFILDKVRAAKATEITSIGGGSMIDVGKWVARELNILHTAIPTTCGTGAEVTKYCVLTIAGKKHSYVDEAFIPTAYILDPENLKTLPKKVKLSSMLDAYCQAWESLWSKNATEESLMYSEMAIRLIENPKNDMDLMIAANMSGRAINIARTNVCHSISYPLTDLFNVPHGFACYMSLKYFANKLGYHIMEVDIPKFDFDSKLVALTAINNDKLGDYPEDIYTEDIIESLKV